MKKILTLLIVLSTQANANLEEDVAKLFPPEHQCKVLAFIAQIPPGVFAEVKYTEPRNDDLMVICNQFVHRLSLKTLQLTCINPDLFKQHADDIWKFIGQLDFLDSISLENVQIPDEVPLVFLTLDPLKRVRFNNCKLGANTHVIQQRVTSDYLVTIDPGLLLQ